MNTLTQLNVRRRSEVAFTFTEMLVSMALFVLVVGGCVAGHVCGLRMFQVTQAKLGSSDAARNISGQLGQEVQAALDLRIGQGDAVTFTELSSIGVQEGNAIQLRTSTDTNDYVRYYVDTSGQRLSRVTRAVTKPETILAGIANAKPFRAEDYGGVLLSNRQNRFVLGLTLQFNAVPGTTIPVGAKQYYKSCEWRMKFTPRGKE